MTKFYNSIQKISNYQELQYIQCEKCGEHIELNDDYYEVTIKKKLKFDESYEDKEDICLNCINTVYKDFIDNTLKFFSDATYLTIEKKKCIDE